jgi:hypothetical protein
MKNVLPCRADHERPGALLSSAFIVQSHGKGEKP